MQIMSLHTYQGDLTQSVRVSLEVLMPTTSLATAVNGILTLFSGQPSPNGQRPVEARVHSSYASEPTAPTTTPTEVSETADKPRRTRRTAAEMEAARIAAEAHAEPVSETSTSAIGSRHRRGVAPVSSPDPMPITDAEMSKAASNTAEELVKLGEDGPGMVMLVLEDYGVKSVGEVLQDRRQAFIKELAKEVELAKLEKEGKE